MTQYGTAINPQLGSPPSTPPTHDSVVRLLAALYLGGNGYARFFPTSTQTAPAPGPRCGNGEWSTVDAVST